MDKEILAVAVGAERAVEFEAAQAAADADYRRGVVTELEWLAKQAELVAVLYLEMVKLERETLKCADRSWMDSVRGISTPK